MNKLIIDKATDKEKRIIREKMSCLLDELDEKDKKKIYFDNDDINIVRDIASDFFLVRVCGGIPNGYEGWHNEVYMLYHDFRADQQGLFWRSERSHSWHGKRHGTQRKYPISQG